jgi:hypothetical protein
MDVSEVFRLGLLLSLLLNIAAGLTGASNTRLWASGVTAATWVGLILWRPTTQVGETTTGDLLIYLPSEGKPTPKLFQSLFGEAQDWKRAGQKDSHRQ